VEPLVRPSGELFEHIAEVREGLDAVELAGFDDAVEGRGALATGIIADEQEILAFMWSSA